MWVRVPPSPQKYKIMKRKKFPEDGYTEYHPALEAYLKKKLVPYGASKLRSYAGSTYLAWSSSNF